MLQWPEALNDVKVAQALAKSVREDLGFKLNYFPNATTTGNYFMAYGKFYSITDLNGFCDTAQKRIGIFHTAEFCGQWSAISCSIAHEMGHAIDFKGKSHRELVDIYRAYNWREVFMRCKDRKLFGYWKAVMYRCEERAWSHAIPILKKFGFQDWGMFEMDREQCLARYLSLHHIA